MSSPSIAMSHKTYMCAACGATTSLNTNHYGDCLHYCKKCSWKGGEQRLHVCMEEPPEGYPIARVPWTKMRIQEGMQAIIRGDNPPTEFPY